MSYITTELKGESLEQLREFINIYFDNFGSVLSTYKNGKCNYNEYIRASFIREWLKCLKEEELDKTFYMYETDLIGFMNVHFFTTGNESCAQIRLHYFASHEQLEEALNYLRETYSLDRIYISVPIGFGESSYLESKGYRIEYECKDVNIYIGTFGHKLNFKDGRSITNKQRKGIFKRRIFR